MPASHTPAWRYPLYVSIATTMRRRLSNRRFRASWSLLNTATCSIRLRFSRETRQQCSRISTALPELQLKQECWRLNPLQQRLPDNWSEHGNSHAGPLIWPCVSASKKVLLSIQQETRCGKRHSVIAVRL